MTQCTTFWGTSEDTYFNDVHGDRHVITISIQHQCALDAGHPMPHVCKQCTKTFKPVDWHKPSS